MTKVFTKLEHVVKQELKKHIIPVKTNDGVLVGNVLIKSEANVKHLIIDGQTAFENISLNCVAIKLANMLALKQGFLPMQQLYRIDQEYGKWYTDCQILMHSHRNAVKISDNIKADVLMARYRESKSRAVSAKEIAERLSKV
jgi:hypothetical protein